MAGGNPVPSVETHGRGAVQIVPCNWYLSTASVYVYTHLRYLANPPWKIQLTQINDVLAGATVGVHPAGARPWRPIPRSKRRAEGGGEEEGETKRGEQEQEETTGNVKDWSKVACV